MHKLNVGFVFNFDWLQHPNPVESGLATDAILEGAGPDCIVPGQIKPVRLLGLKVFLLFIFLKKNHFLL